MQHGLFFPCLVLLLELMLALAASPCAAAEIRLTIMSARLDAKRHRQPVNPRVRVEINDRILRSEPQKATLTPRWNYVLTFEQSEVKSSRFIDFVLYDYRGPGPDDERMIAGKRLYPRDLLRPGTRRVRIGGADLTYKVEREDRQAAAPVPAVPAVSAVPTASRPPVRPGPPIPPLRLFERAAPRAPARRRVLRAQVTGGQGGSIQGVIEGHNRELDECHEEADRPEGEVALLFSISSDGTPLGVLVEKASDNMKEVGECMRRRALKWRFPPSHGVVTARHHMTFGP